MPHFTVHLFDEVLDGQAEPRIIRALTESVVSVYGETMRPRVVVELFGVPRSRWGLGGEPAGADLSNVVLTMREVGLAPRPTVDDPPARLIASITDAMAEVLGAGSREHANVLIIGIPPGRSGVAGDAV